MRHFNAHTHTQKKNLIFIFHFGLFNPLDKSPYEKADSPFNGRTATFQMIKSHLVYESLQRGPAFSDRLGHGVILISG